MKKTTIANFTLSIATIGGLFACGGGGGGSDDVAAAGTWTGGATLVSNTCNFVNVPTTTNFSHVVNQNGSAVTLTDGPLTYLGNTVGDTGFSVDAAGAQDQDAENGVTCDFAQRIEYDGISDNENDGDSDDNPDTASVVISTTRICTNASSCDLRYNGNAVRSGGDATPTSSTTTTTGVPLARDCTLLLERVFSGDGGCGLNSTEVNVVSSAATPSIVLDPFGQNGATTFVPATTGASLAGSVRDDLTINGSAGYSCSLSCAPPLTFRVTCVKEGGTQCSEKF